jgi:hypothetical protein
MTRLVLICVSSIGLMAAVGCVGGVETTQSPDEPAAESDLKASSELKVGTYTVIRSACSPDDEAFPRFVIKPGNKLDGRIDSSDQGEWNWDNSSYRTSRGSLGVARATGAFDAKLVRVEGDILTVNGAGGSGRIRFLYEQLADGTLKLTPEGSRDNLSWCSHSGNASQRYTRRP